METKPIHHRYKIQRRVEVTARDRSNRRFLFAENWRTVQEADNITPAEKILNAERRDHQNRKYRLVEEWPAGSTPRVIHDWRSGIRK
jgi:hypothetical protein